MTYRELLIQGQKYFHNLNYDFSQQLLIYLLNCSIEELFLILDEEIIIKPEKYFYLIETHLKGKPLAYILKKQSFYKRDFLVNKHTLIPRKETEEFADKVLKVLKNSLFLQKPLIILDLGTGSGVIAITLALELPNSKFIGSDISSKALRVAKKNARNLNCLNINFKKSNLLNFFLKKRQKFDVIISNPPYISKNEIISKSVKDYEPHLALFTNDNDGTYFYRSIFKEVKNILNNKALLAFEIGYNQKEILEPLVEQYFPCLLYTSPSPRDCS